MPNRRVISAVAAVLGMALMAGCGSTSGVRSRPPSRYRSPPSLRELAEGDEVDVHRADGSTARFVVRRTVVVPKPDFPTDDVYGDTAGPGLRLITCGGSFDKTAHSYRDQMIVYAAIV